MTEPETDEPPQPETPAATPPAVTSPRRRLSSFLPDRALRRILEGAGEALDRRLGRVEETPSGVSTPQLVERLKRLIDERVRDDGRKGRVAPHVILLKVEWGKHEAASNPALQSLQYELQAAAIDHINDNRYRTLAPVTVEIESDIFTKALSVGVSYGDFEAQMKPGGDAEDEKSVAPPAPADIEYLARVSRPGIESHEVSLFLTPGGRRLSVGRGSDNDLRLGHSSVSKVHAALRMKSDGTIVLADTGSTNGTFLNGRRMAYGEAWSLEDGDVLGFGEVEVRLRRPTGV
jgi:hypothetical protein